MVIYVDLFDYKAKLELKDAVKLLSLYKNLDKIGVVQTIGEKSHGRREEKTRSAD